MVIMLNAIQGQDTKKIPKPERQWIAIIRIRGTVNVKRDVEYTLKLLRLHKPNHCVVRRLDQSLRGMLLKAQHKIAWGEIDFEVLYKLLKDRGYTVGGNRLTDDLVKKFTGGKYKNIEELAKAIWRGEISFGELKWLKPVFRLHPPKHGGYKRSVKKLYQEGGALGYWGPDIKNLLLRMI